VPEAPSIAANYSTNNPTSNPGSSLAALWLRVSQDDQPPASIPSTLLPLIHCPTCDHSLSPPLKSLGYQTCTDCGWSNQPPFIGGSAAASLLPDEELKQLLDQATSESLDNMKLQQEGGYTKVSLLMTVLQTILKGLASTIASSSKRQ
jgi:hypothetical protein